MKLISDLNNMNLKANNLNDLSLNNICDSNQTIANSSIPSILYSQTTQSFLSNDNQIRIESTLDRDHRRAVSFSSIPKFLILIIHFVEEIAFR